MIETRHSPMIEHHQPPAGGVQEAAPETVTKEGHDTSVTQPSGNAEGKREKSPKQQQDHLTLSPEALKVVEEMKARDREVRAHEQAHMAAGAGIVAGGPSYSYQQGPDGHRYAVGGEVQIDTSAIPGDPKATIEKAEQVRKAAMAPANPSGQDMAVAASAQQMINAAQAEMAKAEQNPDNEDGEGSAEGIENNNPSEESKATPGMRSIEEEHGRNLFDQPEEESNRIYGAAAGHHHETGTFIDTMA